MESLEGRVQSSRELGGKLMKDKPNNYTLTLNVYISNKDTYINNYFLKKTTTLLNLQNMFRQKLLSSSVDRFTKR